MPKKTLEAVYNAIKNPSIKALFADNAELENVKIGRREDTTYESGANENEGVPGADATKFNAIITENEKNDKASLKAAFEKLLPNAEGAEAENKILFLPSGESEISIKTFTNRIFAEIQYQRLIADHGPLAGDEHTELKRIFSNGDNKAAIIEKLKSDDLNTQEEIDDKIKALKEATDKAGIKSAMESLGVAVHEGEGEGENNANLNAIFAENQLSRLQKKYQDPNSYLKAALQNNDNKARILEKLAATTDTTAVDGLVTAINDANKNTIIEAGKALGVIAGGFDENKGEDGVLFSNVQYDVLKEKVDKLESETYKTLFNSRADHIKVKLAEKSTVAECLELHQTIKNSSSLDETNTNLIALGLQDDAAPVEDTEARPAPPSEEAKKIYAEIQFAKIITSLENKEKKFHYIELVEQLNTQKAQVYSKLKNAITHDAVKKLVDAIKNANTEDEIKTAMENLGLNPTNNNIKSRHAEKRLSHFVLDLNDTFPSLKTYLLEDSNHKAIVGKLTENPKCNLNELKDPNLPQDQIKAKLGTLLGVPKNQQEDLAKNIYAENQFKLLVANLLTNNPKLKTFVEKAENKTAIIEVLKNKTDAKAREKLFTDVLENKKTVKDIATALTTLLGRGDGNKLTAGTDEVKTIYAENQFLKLKELSKNYGKLTTLLTDKNASADSPVEVALKSKTPEQVDSLFKDLTNPAKDVTAIKGLMQELALGEDDADARLLFGRNQLQRLHDEASDTNNNTPELAKVFELPVATSPSILIPSTNSVIDKLKDLSIDEINTAVKAVKEATTAKALKTALVDIGIQDPADDAVKKLFIENQLTLLLAKTDANQPIKSTQLLDMLKNHKTAIVTAIADDPKLNTLDHFDTLALIENKIIDELTKAGTSKTDLKTNLEALGIKISQEELNTLYGASIIPSFANDLNDSGSSVLKELGKQLDEKKDTKTVNAVSSAIGQLPDQTPTSELIKKAEEATTPIAARDALQAINPNATADQIKALYAENIQQVNDKLRKPDIARGLNKDNRKYEAFFNQMKKLKKGILNESALTSRLSKAELQLSIAENSNSPNLKPLETQAEILNALLLDLKLEKALMEKELALLEEFIEAKVTTNKIPPTTYNQNDYSLEYTKRLIKDAENDDVKNALKQRIAEIDRHEQKINDVLPKINKFIWNKADKTAAAAAPKLTNIAFESSDAANSTAAIKIDTTTKKTEQNFINDYFGSNASTTKTGSVSATTKTQAPTSDALGKHLIPMDIKLKDNTVALKAATIREITATKVESTFHFSDDAMRALEKEKPLGGFRKGTQIPGKATMAWASRNIDNMMAAMDDLNKPLTIIAGNMPDSCIEALAICCKYKGLTAVGNPFVTKIIKDVADNKKDDIFDKHFQKVFPDEKGKTAEQAELTEISHRPTI